MINQNNPFYGSAGFTPMPGTSYAPQNGNYVAQSQTYQNPYIQQPNRFQSIPGRLVNNLDEITPQEVPMDGSVSLFPQSDYSCIYAKTWTKEGTIATVRYVPEQPQTDGEPQKSPLEVRLDQIDQKLDNLSKSMNRQRSYQKRPNSHVKKKEVNDHEQNA